MQVAPRLSAERRQLMHDTDDRIADKIRLRLELGDVDRLGARLARNRRCGILGDDADAGLGPGERDLHLDIAGDHRIVAEDGAHRRRAEGIAKDGRIEDR